MTNDTVCFFEERNCRLAANPSPERIENNKRKTAESRAMAKGIVNDFDLKLIDYMVKHNGST